MFLLQTLVDNGFPSDTIPVIAGLSNDYADYVTTFEEYQVQQRNWWIFPRKSSISKKWFRCKLTWENCPTLHLDINLSKGTSSL